MEKEYYLGLDMGTSSVGWAVTDNKYRILRRKGKDLWGIREFEEASTAAERRTHRISRRNRQREVTRRALVKSYFTNELEKVDSNFLIRLDNSKYYEEDKNEKLNSPNAIFDDKNYTDKDYYKEYPTIFHLRKELIENNHAPYDVRLIYLAVMNLFKRRGHFLNSSLTIENASSNIEINDAYNEFISTIDETMVGDLSLVFPHDNEITNELLLNLRDTLASSKLSRKAKSEKVRELLKVDKKSKREIEVINGFVGLQVDCNKLFDIDKTDNEIKAKFSDFSYSESEPEILEKLGDEYAQVLLAIKKIYDIGTLVETLRGKKYLSFARVEDYEKHKKDLAILKKLVKTLGPEAYDEMFRSEKAGSYSAYVNSNNSDKNEGESKIRRGIRSDYDTFRKYVQKVLKNVEDCEDKQYILDSIETENFMPKQLTAANGVIPNQLHAAELKVILDNASAYLDFLNDKDESGLTVKERILELFTFTLPYYVGPISSSKDSKGWAIRRAGMNTKTIYPWNYKDVIDVEKTRAEFIQKMVRKCTYYREEQVLAKSSMKYQRFAVLNEINNIRIDDVRIDNELKQKLYNEVYKKGKKPTRKAVEKYLFNNGVSKNATITGIDKEINNGLTSYGKFKEIFGEDIEKDSIKTVIEDIIFRCTIFGDSTEMLKDYIGKTYPETQYPALNEKNIRKIVSCKFKDWGRLSANVLDLNGCNRETGEVYSILDAMWDTNNNFMELLHSDKFDYKEQLEAIEDNAIKTLSEITPQFLDEFYFSAPVKRMILQTSKVINEVCSVMKSEPTKIFIEMTRSDDEKGDKGRKDSRKNDLLNKIKEEFDNKDYWTNLVNEEAKSGRLKSKKMYLYIKQMGMDMYSGEEIDLDYLFDDSRYDIDHIHPRHFVKDDNLENNLVLVSKNANQNIKKDYYPIPDTIRTNPKVRALWERLHEAGLINDVKYARLKNNQPFTEDQLAGFIARQLVETGQATKGIADILKMTLPNSKIVYSKAGNVSEFRKIYEFRKSRIVNEFHHAHDAYLNIVVGNVYFTKFTDSPRNFIKNEYEKDKEKNNYHLAVKKMFQYKVERNGYVAWLPEREGADYEPTINTVREMMAKNTPILTRRSFEKQGVINKVTLYGKNKANPESYIPLKTSDPKMADVTKYGGFTSVNICYYFLVEHEVKGKKIRTIECLPGYMQKRVEDNPNELEMFCEKELGLKNFSIRYRKIKVQSLLKIDGYYVYITGKTNKQFIIQNAVNFKASVDCYEYISYIEKYINEGKKKEELDYDKNVSLYEIILSKLEKTLFKNRINSIYKKLLEKKEYFEELEINDQVEVLYQIIQSLSIKGSDCDLTLLKESKNAGKMLISKELTKYTVFKLINQSPAGIYKDQVVDLKTV
ncbi:type II CRISPR RNA-guided endonuclease Cas9 [Lachnospira pectinoschiza]|uniref:CRISPR-associated endonuclease Cas9 n=1 Tax=Lachnospira pectinoschiza TaxID=28052 RepID=A0A1G9U2S5_9FIRM|nr:type II CRISPR RNA-guided endonuclease Cas9 [Lachnospira pectinoschiza]SDM54201.1 CRISPR-associated endonuclease Csn1 [Lachnospira pectinoschiza]